MIISECILTEEKKFQITKKLVESLLQLLEAGDIEWEPQPEFRGVGGTTTATHDSAKRQRGMKDGPSSNRRYQQTNQAEEKVQGLWAKYLKHIKTLPPEKKAELKPALLKIIKVARQQGVMLRPNPSKVSLQ